MKVSFSFNLKLSEAELKYDMRVFLKITNLIYKNTIVKFNNFLQCGGCGELIGIKIIKLIYK